MPKVIVSIQTLTHLSSAWLIHVNYFESSLSFYDSHWYFFNFWQLYDDFLYKVFVSLLDDFWFLFLLFLLLLAFKSLNERLGGNDFHEFKWKNRDFVSFDVLFNHSGKLNDFVPVFFLFILNLPGYFKGLMLLTENKILNFFKIKLLHVHFFLSGTFWMIVLSALWIFTLNTGPGFGLFTNKALMFESFLLDILNTLYIDGSIFLFKIAFGHPNWAHIMYPYVMATGLLCRICGLVKIIVVQLLFGLIRLVWRVKILLLLLVVRTTFWVFVVGWVRLLK